MDPFIPWLSAQIRSRLDQRGQTELLIVALVIFIVWLLMTGQRVVVR